MGQAALLVMIRVQEDPNPVIKTRRRRCLCCQELFARDPRTRSRQRYCAQPACRAASKQASQRRWLGKPENQEYFCGEQQVNRVQAWRAANPGYWRESRLIEQPLQEMIRAQAADRARKSGSLPLQETKAIKGTDAMGQIGAVCGGALQDVM